MYDAEVEAQMYFIFDGNKKLVGLGDIYPDYTKVRSVGWIIRCAGLPVPVVCLYTCSAKRIKASVAPLEVASVIQ